MTKNEMKDLLFDILNEHDTLFSDVTLSDSLDALIIKPIDDGNFIIKVDYLKEGEELIRLWARKNPAFLSLAISLMELTDLKIITASEANSYLAELSKYENELQKKYSNANI